MQALIREVSIKTVPGLGRKCPTVSQSIKGLAWLPGYLGYVAPLARRLENLANGWSTWGYLEGRAGGACWDLGIV